MRTLGLLLILSLACGGGEAGDGDDDEATSGEEISDAPVPPMQTLDPPPEGDPRVNPTAGQEPVQAVTCTSMDECGDGEICSGEEGCDVPWTCVPQRPCTRDLVVYCGCDGQTHRGSGSCPPAPYVHRGPCE